MKLENKIYFLHNLPNGLGADFFLKKGKSILEKEHCRYRIYYIALLDKLRNKYHVDYVSPACPYIEEFLKENPNYIYLGSTDKTNEHDWGMSFDGFKEINCPELKGGN